MQPQILSVLLWETICIRSFAHAIFYITITTYKRLFATNKIILFLIKLSKCESNSYCLPQCCNQKFKLNSNSTILYLMWWLFAVALFMVSMFWLQRAAYIFICLFELQLMSELLWEHVGCVGFWTSQTRGNEFWYVQTWCSVKLK